MSGAPAKTSASRSAARDPLLAALIGKLPKHGPWEQDDRTAWLNLMKAAFDVVYGRDGAPALLYADATAAEAMAAAVARPEVVDIPRMPLRGVPRASAVAKQLEVDESVVAA